MGRKRRNDRNKKRRSDDGSEYGGIALQISPEAMRGVSAVFLLAFAGFLILANFDIGGFVGNTIHEWLSWALGIGYMLLPLSLILAAIAILRSFEKHFGVVQVMSVCVFLLSTLGMVNLAFPGRGGILGASVSTPIVSAVDAIATVIFLSAFTLAALIIAFDIHLGSVISRLHKLFARESSQEELKYDYEVLNAAIVGLPTESVEDTGSGEGTGPEGIDVGVKGATAESKNTRFFSRK